MLKTFFFGHTMSLEDDFVQNYIHEAYTNHDYLFRLAIIINQLAIRV
jgi:hypothetical protein